MKNWLLIIVVVFLMLGACSINKQNKKSVMRADYGTLHLLGDPIGRVVTLDGKVIQLDSEKTINIFELKSGTYFLQISSVEQVLLSQKLLIVDAQVNEVLMP